MKYDPTKHHRQSIRLKGYDYHNAGAYFITICVKNRECILDDIILNSIIKDVWFSLSLWFPTIELDEFVIMPNHVHFVIWLGVLDAHAGTPLAGILNGENKDAHVGTPLAGILNGENKDAHVGTPLAGILNGENKDGHVGTPLAGILNGENKDGGKPRPYVLPSPQKTNPNPTLGDVVGAFKSLVFKTYLNWIETNNVAKQAKFWQNNYYEHIVRNDRELNAIRQYIIDNPRNWQIDRDNLDNINKLPPPTKMEDYLEELYELMGWTR